MLPPCASRKLENRAWRGARQRAENVGRDLRHRGPETRMTPTAPRPGALAMATMVSGELTGDVFTISAWRPRLRPLG